MQRFKQNTLQNRWVFSWGNNPAGGGMVESRCLGNSCGETMRMRPWPEGMRTSSVRRPVTLTWRGTTGRAAPGGAGEVDRRKGSA